MKNLNSGGTKSGKVNKNTITINMAGVPDINGAILMVDREQTKEYIKVKSITYSKDGGNPIITVERL